MTPPPAAPPPLPFAIRFSFLTRPLTLPALCGGLGLLVGVGVLDYAALKLPLYLPLYYAVFIFWGAWRYGSQMGLFLTLLSAALNGGLDFWLAPPWPSPFWIQVQRGLWFTLFYGVAWGLSLGQLLLEYYRHGSAWRGQLQPLRVGERLVLLPTQKAGPALDPSEQRVGDIPIRINPGTAFGTGSHPTTQMCLALLEKYIQPGDRVFDLGSGSGILAIAAIKLGATHAVAADIDPEAQRVIGANLAVNDLTPADVTYRAGSLEVARLIPDEAANAAPPAYEQFNVTIANILAHVILEALRDGLGETLTPTGLLIISGIKTDQRAELQTALTNAHLTIVEERTTLTDPTAETWLAVVARRASGES